MTKMQDIDYIVRKVFTNFTLQGRTVEKSTLNKPFDELYALNISNGAQYESQLELFDIIANHCDLLQAWNAEVKGFLGQEHRPAAVSLTF